MSSLTYNTEKSLDSPTVKPKDQYKDQLHTRFYDILMQKRKILQFHQKRNMEKEPSYSCKNDKEVPRLHQRSWCPICMGSAPGHPNLWPIPGWQLANRASKSSFLPLCSLHPHFPPFIFNPDKGNVSDKQDCAPACVKCRSGSNLSSRLISHGKPIRQQGHAPAQPLPPEPCTQGDIVPPE